VVVNRKELLDGDSWMATMGESFGLGTEKWCSRVAQAAVLCNKLLPGLAAAEDVLR
jgi:hypothetical protein